MTGIRPQTWTPAILSEVERLWTEGKTALAIATQFGMTRSMIAGIVSRNGWKRPECMNVSNRSNGNAKGHVSRKAPAPKPKPPKLVEPLPPSVSLLALQSFHCRWPVQDGPEWRFCGLTKTEGSYCCRHARLAFSLSKVRAA